MGTVICPILIDDLFCKRVYSGPGFSEFKSLPTVTLGYVILASLEPFDVTMSSFRKRDQLLYKETDGFMSSV